MEKWSGCCMIYIVSLSTTNNLTFYEKYFFLHFALVMALFSSKIYIWQTTSDFVKTYRKYYIPSQDRSLFLCKQTTKFLEVGIYVPTIDSRWRLNSWILKSWKGVIRYQSNFFPAQWLQL